MATDPDRWRCPFCGHDTILHDDDQGYSQYHIESRNRHGPLLFTAHVRVCPNPDCREVALDASLLRTNRSDPSQSDWDFVGGPLGTWNLRPGSDAKPLPEYIPGAIREDYVEACRIKKPSPKAAATLARRCLQGMIRDFFRVRAGTLKEEIEAIRDKVDPLVWDGIEAVRKIGNIGAHMEKDVNLVLEVEPKEAELLIKLIEDLLADWYVAREERKKRTQALIVAADKKDQQKKASPPRTPPKPASK